MRVKNLIGKKFGKLSVIARAENSPGGKAKWICLCDCGRIKEKAVLSFDLSSGKVKSCGCLYYESNKNINKTHGLTGGRLHRIWCSMKQRCFNPQSTGFKNYGGAGISICDEWRNDFQAFYEWAMAHGYADDLTIDRIDNGKGYSPDNCRWVDMKKQQNNRRNNRKVDYCGCEYTISELAAILNIPYATLLGRINSGWDQSEWGIKPNFNSKGRKKHEHN